MRSFSLSPSPGSLPKICSRFPAPKLQSIAPEMVTTPGTTSSRHPKQRLIPEPLRPRGQRGLTRLGLKLTDLDQSSQSMSLTMISLPQAALLPAGEVALGPHVPVATLPSLEGTLLCSRPQCNSLLVTPLPSLCPERLRGARCPPRGLLTPRTSQPRPRPILPELLIFLRVSGASPCGGAFGPGRALAPAQPSLAELPVRKRASPKRPGCLA